jgi:hypothetical protein
MTLNYVSNPFILNKIMVEAAGVELFCILITRKLLIPGTATTAKKAPLPRSIVRLLYENVFAPDSRRLDSDDSIPQIR